jgi:hypothetical protein
MVRLLAFLMDFIHFMVGIHVDIIGTKVKDNKIII